MSKFLWYRLLFRPVILGLSSLFLNTAVLAVEVPPTDAVTQSQKSDVPLSPGLVITELDTNTQVPDQVSAPQQTTHLRQVPDRPLGSNSLLESQSDITPMDQVTSVFQLSDVQSSDWAFQALQSLVERYGCIAGYPDSTFRGKQTLTRYEFAADVNTCLDRINKLIASATSDLLRQEDLTTIQRLQQEFVNELSVLRGRVDHVEARTAELKEQQFSTTTKLAGEAVFTVAAASNQAGTKNQAVFQNRVRLDFQSSFTGKDTLHARIGAGNVPNFALPSNPAAPPGVPTATGLQTIQEGYANDSAIIDWLAYYLKSGEKTQFYVAAILGAHTDYLPSTANPYIDNSDGGSGSLTLYGKNNSIYNIGGGTGLGITYKLNNAFQLSAGYLAGGGDSPANPQQKNGLFNGSYSALGQLTVNPKKNLTFAFT